MNDRNWRDWDAQCPNKEDSTRNPYYNQPTHSPYRGQGFAIASMVFGVIAFVLNAVVMVPFFCAGFSFLFGALASRTKKRRSSFILYGFVGSVFGIGSGIMVLMQTLTQLQPTLSELLSRIP